MQEFSDKILIVILCVFLSALSFWVQALITSERFVPALNVICTYFNITDDVAGATLMAAGASAAELFVVFLSVFITHSSIGLGTVIGSEIFNQLCICAGSILAAKNQTLTLNPPIIIRELAFYSISAALLYAIVAWKKEDDVGTDEHEGEITISFINGVTFLLVYVLYVVVCANFDDIISCMTKYLNKGTNTEEGYNSYMNVQSIVSPKRRDMCMQVPDLPFVRSFHHEEGPDNSMRTDSRDVYIVEEKGSEKPKIARLYSLDDHTFDSNSTTNSVIDDSLRSDSGEAWVDSYCLGDMYSSKVLNADITEVESNQDERSLSCFLWQKSAFYSKARISIHAWQLRWFTFYDDRFMSVPDRRQPMTQSLLYPPFEYLIIDEEHHLINICTSAGRPDYVFLVPSSHTLKLVAEKLLQLKSQSNDKLEAAFQRYMTAKFRVFDEPITDDLITADALRTELIVSLISLPQTDSISVFVIFIVQYPLRALIHYTIPDVRRIPYHKSTPSLKTAFISILMSIVWLIPWSYVMVWCLVFIGHELRIPDAVMGATVTAAGTSVPNYVASQVAAEQGLTDMAISNAIGSNTFNVLVCLGLPWVFVTLFQGGSYVEVRDGNILISIIFMIAVNVAFILLLIWTRFILSRSHALFFLGLYALFIVLVVTYSSIQ